MNEQNKKTFFDKIEQVLAYADENGLYPDIYTIHGASTSPEVQVLIDGTLRPALMFSSNNYLGIATDPRIKKAFLAGAETYGMGSGGSRLVTGNIDVQEKLEHAIAEFKGYEAAITFSTGYMANTGAIPALLNPIEVTVEDVIKKKFFWKDTPTVFSDELNHASIIDGCRTAKAERVIYAHKDMVDLQKKLKRTKRSTRKLIITDGVFSMDGDIAPLREIMKLGKTYDAAVMVDDAHGTGALGENGSGTAEFWKLEEKPEIIMGTFTKAFGAVGGFICGSAELIRYLRVAARTHVFSAPIPPAIAEGLLAALQIVREEKRHIQLMKNARYIRDRLKSSKFNILESETQIIPVVIGDENTSVEVSRELLRQGIFVPAIRWPAVEKKKARLRVTIMATHTKDHLDAFFEKLLAVRKKHPF